MRLKNIGSFIFNNKINNYFLFSSKKKDLYCIINISYLETLGVTKNSSQN
jgi:hypothetical protein